MRTDPVSHGLIGTCASDACRIHLDLVVPYVLLVATLVLTLMNELIEGMLAIGTRFSPHNGPSGVINTSTLSRH